jgi:hypothetical protein
MPDEATPEAPESTGTPQESQTTPDTGAPVAEDSQAVTPDVNWQQRYEDLRPEADRRANVLNDIQGLNGPERQAQALAEYANVEIASDDPEPDDEQFDPYNVPDPSAEVQALRDEIEQDRLAAEVAQLEAQEDAFIDDTVANLEQEGGVQLSNDQYDLLYSYALAHRDPTNQRPDIEGAFNAVKGLGDAAVRNYTNAKSGAVQPPVGTSGEPKIDPRNKAERIKAATAAYEAAEAQKNQ